MSYTFSRRDFLKYSALTAVAVAGAGLLTGCEIQDPNNPVIKKLGYGTTLGTTGGLLKSVDTEGTDGVFTFTVKNNSDAPLRMTPPHRALHGRGPGCKGQPQVEQQFQPDHRGCSGGGRQGS